MREGGGKRVCVVRPRPGGMPGGGPTGGLGRWWALGRMAGHGVGGDGTEPWDGIEQKTVGMEPNKKTVEMEPFSVFSFLTKICPGRKS